MKRFQSFRLACLLAVGAAALPIGRAEATHVRQYYGAWARHTTYTYHYRVYYYKPAPTYVGYRHHYVIYYPSRPQYVYYYNPYTRVYWGRSPVNCCGKPQYSLLAEKDRKGNLTDIPESAFPTPGKLPPVPESDPKEGVAMDLPPDDLPTDSGLPGAKSESK